jgi:hypothetical protein
MHLADCETEAQLAALAKKYPDDEAAQAAITAKLDAMKPQPRRKPGEQGSILP